MKLSRRKTNDMSIPALFASDAAVYAGPSSSDIAPTGNDPVAQLSLLAQLKSQGVINEAEFNTLKHEIVHGKPRTLPIIVAARSVSDTEAISDKVCPRCEGKGWTLGAEHATGCDGMHCNKLGCPVMVQVECDERKWHATFEWHEWPPEPLLPVEEVRAGLERIISE